MKTTGDVLKSNYCKVLSQKCRQVFKPLAGVTLRALIVLFDVISHHEQRNPSYMVNCAVFKTPCTLQNFFSCCLKKPPYFSLAAWTFWSSVLSSICVKLRGRCLWKEPGGSFLLSKAGGLHRLSCLWHAGNLEIPHCGATFCCLCTTGATFQLGELRSCLM